MTMSNVLLKQNIEACIQQSPTHPFASFCYSLLAILGYDSQRRIEIASVDDFLHKFDQTQMLSHPDALLSEWNDIQLLFQLTGEELSQTVSMFSIAEIDQKIYNSYLFFGIELHGTTYTRTQLANITRQINKLFQIPVLIIYKYGQQFSIAIINRRPNQRDQNKDVLGKVTLIKDIDVQQPHRAHVEILTDLAVQSLTAEHAIRSFDDLHHAWARVLDTSVLNKRFYKELADWYFWTMGEVRFPADAPKDGDQRDSISLIRLVTRLMFCWFLKEKGLLPHAIFDSNHINKLLKEHDPDSSSYYKAVLQNLFFATLNQEMGKRGFRTDSQHFMVHTLYRYRDLLHDPDAFIGLLADVPFMNGGLFECLDKVKDTTYERIDGFSDRPDNQIHVPNKVFFGEDIMANLESVYNDKSARSVRVRGLIHILNRYKFTITENTPIEEEIALDPELLGKVFENLLAAYSPDTQTTARNQTGSFYTPREIVDYMVDEALVLKLQESLTQLDASRHDHRARLVDLISYNNTPHQFAEREVQHLINHIDTLKILDPACGSGAFPMGILHKLVYILSKLDPQNQRWRQRQIDRIEALEDIIMRKDIMADVEASFSAHELDYGRKLYLIQNCIYGVDIQPIAVQISKLRFFISLLVNQHVNNGKNRGILPLPNLETNFIAANTLLKLSDDMHVDPKRKMAQRSLIDNEIDNLKAALRKQRNRYFSARTTTTKEKARSEDKRIRADMRNVLTNSGWDTTEATVLSAWDMYDQNSHADFFDPEWMFGIDNGIDIVIGNPPYLRIQGLQSTQPQYMERYKRFRSATGSYDLYALFIERGYELLKTGDSHGILAYIVPHKFFIAKFGEGLRKLLTEKQALTAVVKFGSLQLFDEATTYSSLVFLTTMPQAVFDLVEIKQLTTGSDVLDVARQRNNAKDGDALPTKEFINITHPDLSFGSVVSPSTTEWNFSLGARQVVFERIKQHKTTLQDITQKIFQGIATGADKIFVLDVHNQDSNYIYGYSVYLDQIVTIEKSLTRPFLMGRDVHRYNEIHQQRVIVFPYDQQNKKIITSEILSEKYTHTWQYLNLVKSHLVAREQGRYTTTWWQFSRPQNLTEFEQIKIITPDLCARPEMTVDLQGSTYHTTTIHSIIFNAKAPQNIYFLLGLLNSQVLRFFMTITGNEQRGGYHRYTPGYLKPFPIPESTPAQQERIATLVKYVLALKRAKALHDAKNREYDIIGNFFERLIDGLVYELYMPEVFLEQPKLRISLGLQGVELPQTTSSDDGILGIVTPYYQLLSDRDHPVRHAEYYMNTLKEVRVLMGKEPDHD